MADEQERLKKAAAEARQQAINAENRANNSSCFIYDAEVLMFDGAIKMIKDIGPGDKLRGLGNNLVTVVFVDVSELGNRSLVGLNGRAARMTEDHPVYSAVFNDSNQLDETEEMNHCLQLGAEPLLFAHLESALASRHWPNAQSFSIGSSMVWSHDVNINNGLLSQKSEVVENINWLPSGTLPSSTLVYDIITDMPSYNVDGIFVRSDFPPVLAYPQASLLVERLATLVVHHEVIRAITVSADIKSIPKSKEFDIVAREFELELSKYIAQQHLTAESFANSSIPLQSSVSTYFDMNPTFSIDCVTSEFQSCMNSSKWIDVLSAKYKDFTSQITRDAKLAWSASRLWAVLFPILQCLLKDAALQSGESIDKLSIIQFNAVEKKIISIARATWRIGERESESYPRCSIAEKEPANNGNKLFFVAIADFEESVDSPVVNTENIAIFKKAIGTRMMGEIVSFIGEKQSGKTALLLKRATAKGYDTSGFSLPDSHSLWLIWGCRDSSEGLIIDVYLIEQRLLALSFLCSSFVTYLYRSCSTPDRSLISKFHSAANFVFDFLHEKNNDEDESEIGIQDISLADETESEMMSVEEFINDESDDLPQFLMFVPNLSINPESCQIYENNNDEIDSSSVTTHTTKMSSDNDNKLMKDRNSFHHRKLLILPAVSFVLVNSTLVDDQQTSKSLAEIMFDVYPENESKRYSRNVTLDALGLFPEVVVTQVYRFEVSIVLIIDALELHIIYLT